MVSCVRSAHRREAGATAFTWKRNSDREGGRRRSASGPSGRALVQYHRPEMSAITHLFAGVPVSDHDASIDWYTRFFGRPPDSRVGEEILWEIDERAWLFI